MGLRGLRARIKSNNDASLAAFAAAGFHVVGEDEGVVHVEAPSAT
jgi:L-amino acid N-acyltransferase YncA